MTRNSPRVLVLVAAFLTVPPPMQAESQDPRGYGFFQVGAFREPARAEALSAELDREGFSVYVLSTEEFVRVLAGPYCDSGEIESARRALTGRGYPSLFRMDNLVESIPADNCARGAETTSSADRGSDGVLASSAVVRADVGLGLDESDRRFSAENDVASPGSEESKPGRTTSIAGPALIPRRDTPPRRTFGSGLVVAAPRLEPSTATFSGTIKDASGGVMPGVRVRLFYGNATESVLETVTDAAGNFTFGDPTGEHRIAVSVPGFAPYEETFSVEPGMEPLVVILTSKGSGSRSPSDWKTN